MRVATIGTAYPLNAEVELHLKGGLNLHKLSFCVLHRTASVFIWDCCSDIPICTIQCVKTAKTLKRQSSWRDVGEAVGSNQEALRSLYNLHKETLILVTCCDRLIKLSHEPSLLILREFNVTITLKDNPLDSVNYPEVIGTVLFTLRELS